jgi:hypothetical protein
MTLAGPTNGQVARDFGVKRILPHLLVHKRRLHSVSANSQVDGLRGRHAVPGSQIGVSLAPRRW